MSDFWEEWAGVEKKLLPAGEYNTTLQSAGVDHDGQGRPRTKLCFTVCDGENFQRQNIWLDWPHMPEKFGWLARKVWFAIGRGEQRPEGNSPEEVMLSISRALPEFQGRTFRLNVAVHKDGNGEERNRVKELTLLGGAAQQAPQAPVHGYGSQQPPMIQAEANKPTGEPAPWSY